METTTIFGQHSITADAVQTKTSIWEKAEESRYGINMLVIGLVIMFGSMAAPYAVNLGDVQFALVIFPTVFSLILVMGLAPLKMIVYTAGFALMMNILIFLLGAIR